MQVNPWATQSFLMIIGLLTINWAIQRFGIETSNGPDDDYRYIEIAQLIVNLLMERKQQHISTHWNFIIPINH